MSFFDPKWLPGNPENPPAPHTWIMFNNAKGEFCAYLTQIISSEIEEDCSLTGEHGFH